MPPSMDCVTIQSLEIIEQCDELVPTGEEQGGWGGRPIVVAPRAQYCPTVT